MKIISFFIFTIFTFKGFAQTNDETPLLATSLAKKITIAGFCLCQTTLSDLQKLCNDLTPTEVEEMDLGKKCISQDSRFENGKGYYANKFPGMIFQKDQTSNRISKIRLTKDFKGNLPDGTPINLKNLKLSDVFNIYPNLKNNWFSRDCSDYYSFANDTLFFYVKVDTTKKPQFPIDEAYYYDKPIEAIDLLISCYEIFDKKEPYKQLFNDPVFFIDSINITRLEMQAVLPADIATVTIYKDTNAIKLVGEQGKYGVVYIETKKFATNNYFKSKSAEYLKIVQTPGSDSAIVYIVNGKVLKTNFEGDLSVIDDHNFVSLLIVNKQHLVDNYKILNKTYGVIIVTKPTNKAD